MKKLIAMLLALAMVFALAACGSSGAPAASSGNAAPAASSADASAPAESTPTEGPAYADVEPLTITFSSTFQETETGGIIQKHFIDYLSEITGGNITVDITWGGTLYDSNGELKAVQDGVVDMIAFGHMPHLDTVPYMSFPGFAPGGTKAALDYFDTLMFKDPETSALIQGEAEELGIKYLNVIAGGANAFCASFEYTDLADMVAKCGAFGNFDAAIFEYLGFQVTAVMPPDCYDALNRGLIQATQMGLAPMVSMAWYEVAPYWSLDGTYTGGNFFTVNLDWWNGLTDGQRAAIEDACAEVEDYSANMYDDAIADDLKTITDNGGTIVELSQEDMDKVWEATFIAKANDAMARAERSGKTEGMTVILEKAAEITGFNWEH